MTKFYLNIIAVILIFVSCNKEVTSQNQPDISGKWQLLNKIGGFTGKDTISPTSTTFLTLNSNRKFTEETNGTISQQGNYEIGLVKSIFTQQAEFAIRFKGGDFKLLTFKGDSLFLVDNHTEPYKTSYKRIN
jgi:hypothetical protein